MLLVTALLIGDSGFLKRLKCCQGTTVSKYPTRELPAETGISLSLSSSWYKFDGLHIENAIQNSFGDPFYQLMRKDGPQRSNISRPKSIPHSPS
jgi:hypothetical protein